MPFTEEDTSMSQQNPIFIPGPTNVPDRLRHAMNVQTQDHRAPDFVKTFLPGWTFISWNAPGAPAPRPTGSRRS